MSKELNENIIMPTKYWPTRKREKLQRTKKNSGTVKYINWNENFTIGAQKQIWAGERQKSTKLNIGQL